MIRGLPKAISRAKQYILVEAEKHFPEVCHTMYFPRQAGFTSENEEHSSDVFARAVLAGILLDIIELEDRDVQFKATLSDIVQREARYVAKAKLKDKKGGWSYFPDLPELPPDLDSLSAVLLLFARAAPEYLYLCQEPVDLFIRNVMPDGSLETWMTVPDDNPVQRELMLHGIKRYWGSDIDTGVCAHFYRALLNYDYKLFTRTISKGTEFIISKQQPGGNWESTWYWGHAYATGLCLRLLWETSSGEAAISRAMEYFQMSQWEDGGWGILETVPLDTALATWILCLTGVGQYLPAIERGTRYLLERQAQDGHWEPSPWIKMDVGRANGHITHTLTYSSITMATAFCFRALLIAHRILI